MAPHLIGTVQNQAVGQFMNVYFNLIPVVAKDQLERMRTKMSKEEYEQAILAIPKIAEQIAVVTMAKIGITINVHETAPQS